MAKLKIAEFAANIGKSSGEIAADTGLNRNTVAALFKGDAAGIRLSTLERICRTYRVPLTMLVEFDLPVEREFVRKPTAHKIYKQEAELAPFTSWPWVLSASTFRLEHSGRTYGFGQQETYIRKDYGEAYWELEVLRDLALAMYDRYGKRAEYEKLYARYRTYAAEIEELFDALHTDGAPMAASAIRALFGEVRRAYEGFWDTSLFIDAFDTGVDHELIASIAKEHDLDKREIGILSTPIEMTFADERKHALLTIVKRGMRTAASKPDPAKALMRAHKKEVEQYLHAFDYYKSNYAGIKHLTPEETESEIALFMSDRAHFDAEYARLESYAKVKQADVGAVLRRKKLSENPLWFFANVTYWREHRKKVNLMGFHVLHAVLDGLEERTGIPKRYLAYLSFDEVDNVLKGLLPVATLRARYEEGIMITSAEGTYKLFEGREAQSIKDDLERALAGEAEESSILFGQTASQGYAKGIARVILTQEDFGRFKEGEILVTSMTRPEFVPLMRRAAGIVTNEGGITCHAAIVSRELGKPCVIGTKKATTMVKDGDVVEVRANHGTVRILTRED